MVDTKQVPIVEVSCLRCGHKWVARKARIRVCPECSSPYWDVPRKNKTGD